MGEWMNKWMSEWMNEWLIDWFNQSKRNEKKTSINQFHWLMFSFHNEETANVIGKAFLIMLSCCQPQSVTKSAGTCRSTETEQIAPPSCAVQWTVKRARHMRDDRLIAHNGNARGMKGVRWKVSLRQRAKYKRTDKVSFIPQHRRTLQQCAAAWREQWTRISDALLWSVNKQLLFRTRTSSVAICIHHLLRQKPAHKNTYICTQKLGRNWQMSELVFQGQPDTFGRRGANWTGRVNRFSLPVYPRVGPGQVSK